MFRVPLSVACIALSSTAVPAAAQQGGFDLAGPDLSITVRRGADTLPLIAVPSLKAGDRLTLRADLPADQSARYLLVVAFLRGATNPPPRDWFFRAETWKAKRATLDIAVPAGAEQAIALMVPEAGGGFDAVRGAVRGRPGIFVRAAQDLYQASLDRARLDTFVGAIGRIGEEAPDRLAATAPVLADALRVKLNADCLLRQRALQAACLMQDRNATVLQAQRGATLTETLTGAPVDLAYRVAATREGGAGFYSPYIGLARDLARLFGAFQSAQYQYLPALGVGSGDRLRLYLNSAPSFQNPRSVLVAPLPPIGAGVPPVWRSTASKPVCLTRPDTVLPLDDAALLFATDYARDLRLTLAMADGRTVEVPLERDVTRGGVRPVPAGPVPGPVRAGVVHGRWGFDAFTGPRVAVQADAGDAWTPHPDAAVVVGRDSPVLLRGGAAACVAEVAVATPDGGNRALAWEATAPDEGRVTLPLGKARPGPVTLRIARFGSAAPQVITLTGQAEASRLDRFTVHAGDRDAVLTGQRLDQVRGVDFAGQAFAPGTLTRGTAGDRLALRADAPVTDGTGDAVVRLQNGRTAPVPATLAPSRPAIQVIAREVRATPAPGTLPITLADDMVPPDATFSFSLRVAGGVPADAVVEIAAADGAPVRLTVASGAVQRLGDIAVARFVPREALGLAASGALRVRMLRGEGAGDWQPLGQIVRVPMLTGLACPGGGDCTLAGRDLFTLATVGEDGRAVPPGFVGEAIAVSRPAGRTLPLRLYDAPDRVVTATLPGG